VVIKHPVSGISNVHKFKDKPAPIWAFRAMMIACIVAAMFSFFSYMIVLTDRKKDERLSNCEANLVHDMKICIENVGDKKQCYLEIYKKSSTRWGDPCD